MTPLTEQQRQKLMKRLSLPTSSDRGQASAAVIAALAEQDLGTVLVDLVSALAGERLLLPIFPHSTEPGHVEGTLASQLTEVEVSGVKAIAAFVDIQAVNKYDSKARPVPVAVRQLATWAAAARRSLVIDIERGIFLPLGALEALAVGEKWLAPWQDSGLGERLQKVVQSLDTVVDLAIFPFLDGIELRVKLDFTSPDLAHKEVREFISRIQEKGVFGPQVGPVRVVPEALYLA
ncbi:hypothetical protein KRX54_05170 [Actinomycetaceae bacterium TAE3-ERU4]|nr:hypothetical protein [Actinomycetaceae bacterium TAE3-ERU4]